MRSTWLCGCICLFLLAGCSQRRGQDPQPLADADPGRKHFNAYCSACHQYDDQGMGEAPPLDRSAWVTGPEDRLIKIVLHGVRGPIEVHGKTYNREMPGFGQILSSGEIASLLTFVRTRFGDSSPPILEESVDRVRAANPGRTDYWGVDELLTDR